MGRGPPNYRTLSYTPAHARALRARACAGSCACARSRFLPIFRGFGPLLRLLKAEFAVIFGLFSTEPGALDVTTTRTRKYTRSLSVSPFFKGACSHFSVQVASGLSRKRMCVYSFYDISPFAAGLRGIPNYRTFGAFWDY